MADETAKTIQTQATPQPFLKWAGGKRNLLPELKKRMPKVYSAYYEPFVGGGALFFSHPMGKSFLSDVNEELITCYRVIKDSPEALIQRLAELKADHSEKQYYEVRSRHDLENPLERAARMIYLNKTCYNGLYRVNSKNEFNVPMGRYKSPGIFDEANLRLCSRWLQETSLEGGDFTAIRPEQGDFVYFDPPYHDTFTGYTPLNFNEDDQIRLRDFCLELDSQGIFVMVSNSDTPFIRKIYKPFREKGKISAILAPRPINSKADERKNGKEVIITNYRPGRKHSQ